MPVAQVKSVSLFETVNCLITDAVGDLVYITGDPVGGLLQVTKGDPNVAGKHPVVAVIVEKITDTECTVQFDGRTPDIYVGLTSGELYWLGATGVPSLSPVSAAPQAIGIAVSALSISLNFDEDLKPTVGSGSPWTQDEYDPTNGQVTFILTSTPTDPSSVIFMVNGIVADDVIDFTVSGTTVTWLNNLFVLDTSDKVLIKYQ